MVAKQILSHERGADIYTWTKHTRARELSI